MRRESRSQVTHVPISNCSCSMCAMTVSKLMSTCGNNSCASGNDGRCASNGGFLSGRACRLGPFSTAGARRLRAFVHYRSSHNRVKRDCGLLFLNLHKPLCNKCALASMYTADIENYLFVGPYQRDSRFVHDNDFWPDCKPEGPLFSAEFVCLPVCL